ncbi:PD40 domain-containing protein [Candidatus Poribacteria bacterium]|nr:PD40 domain-containing protein [Candidatus Poribacteria bacterium]
MQLKQLVYIVPTSVLLLSSIVLAMNVQAQVPGKAQITFTSYRDGNAEIYVMDADGKNLRNLTKHPAFDGGSTWSPDGRQIAFASNRDGNGSIYVMDADGKNPHRLTNPPVGDTSPAWSPDGRQIAFISWREGNAQIYVMDADGQNVRKLTNDPEGAQGPAWFDPAVARSVSPAGKRASVWGALKRLGW